MAVTLSLTSVEAGLGLGLGLFGVLSIIRLRSDQIAQEEVAYSAARVTARGIPTALALHSTAM